MDGPHKGVGANVCSSVPWKSACRDDRLSSREAEIASPDCRVPLKQQTPLRSRSVPPIIEPLPLLGRLTVRFLRWCFRSWGLQWNACPLLDLGLQGKACPLLDLGLQGKACPLLDLGLQWKACPLLDLGDNTLLYLSALLLILIANLLIIDWKFGSRIFRVVFVAEDHDL